MNPADVHFEMDAQSWLTLVLAIFVAGVTAVPSLTKRISLRRRLVLWSIAGVVVLGVVPFLHVRGPSADQLSFNPVTGNTQACQSFAGSGSIPAGYSLLIFDRADRGLYFFDGNALPTTTGWQTPKVNVGASTVEVAASLVPTSLADYLHSIRTINKADGTPSDAGWESNLLPGDLVAPGLVVHPDPQDQNYC